MGRRTILLQGPSLPRTDLLYAALTKNGLVDSIGELSITLTTGTADDLANATWQFPDTEVTQQVATATGVDLFTVRAGYGWYALLNVNYAWIGFHPSRGGIVFYSSDMSEKAYRIQKYLGYYITTGFPFTLPFNLG